MNKKLLLILLFIFVLGIVGCGTSNIKITSITIETECIEIEVGEDKNIPITYDGKGDYSDLNFIVSDENIVSINSNYVTGISEGITSLTVSSKKDETIKATINIYVNPEGFEKKFVRVAAPSNALIVGNSLEFRVDNLKSLNVSGNEDFIFSVTDPSVLQLNDNYTVTALKDGVCTIQARQKNAPGNIGELLIYVGLQSSDVTFSGEPENTPLVTYFEDNNFIIDCNKDEQIQILGAKDYQRYYYKSEDENILLISDTGLFMGVKEGEVGVTISSKDSRSGMGNAKIKIKVTGERKRDYVPQLLKIALAEEGYREWTGNNDTKYGEWNNCNYEAWCATFVSWCLNNAGVPKEICIRSISVRVYETTYRTKGQFMLKEEYQPKAGDLIIFSSAGASHVGIVVSSDSTTVYTIEGNTSNMVAQRSYPLMHEEITGYIVPDYDKKLS